MFKGPIKFQKQTYIVEQVMDKESIVGKYAVGFEMGQYTKIFVIEINAERSGIQRPVVFHSQGECINFISELHFPNQFLKAVEITPGIYDRDIFPSVGAFLMKKSSILLP